MSITLLSMLMKCLQPSDICWWNVYNPLIYADEMSKTLWSMLMKCLKPSDLYYEMSTTLSSMLKKGLHPLIYADEMSTTLWYMLMKCLKPSDLYYEMSTTLSSILRNVYNPLIYADEMSTPSHLYCWNVYNPLIYADEMSTTLWSMLMKCLQPSSQQDPSMRTSMCGTSLFLRWSSRSPSHIRAGSPAWPGCQLTSWLLSGMIMQSWLGISLAWLWSDDGWWWWMMIMDDGWCMMTVCSLRRG